MEHGNDALAALAELERHYDGPIPEPLRLIARTGSAKRALSAEAEGQTRFFAMMIRMWTTEIAVTTYRFIKKTGVFTLETNEIALPNIEGVRVSQSFLGRIFNYGHVRIEGTGVDAIDIPTIADPIGFLRAIETAKEGPGGAKK